MPQVWRSKERTMTDFESRLQQLERQLRMLESGRLQDLQMMQTSAQSASGGRRPMPTPPSPALCWNCSNALVIEARPRPTGDGQLRRADAPQPPPRAPEAHAVCRLYAGATDGRWRLPTEKFPSTEDILICYSHRPVE